jgi:ABC-type multidrug transport system ATPase subunit
MIGYPRLMMIDECTTGLDPGARHLAWRVLKAADGDDVELPAMLLSTHYMDEASQLGDRVGIMIDGEIASVGSLSELRAEYCKSYFVEISLVPTIADSSTQQRILDLLAQHQMPSHVYESLPHRFKIQIPFTKNEATNNNQIHQLADIFELLNGQKSAIGIQFFSVSQMSLEQIFIDLSRRQFAPKLGGGGGTTQRRQRGTAAGATTGVRSDDNDGDNDGDNDH